MRGRGLRILIVGGTGLIGTRIAEWLNDKGYEISILSRSPSTTSIHTTYSWNPADKVIESSALTNKDVIINLSGANLAEKYWTKKRKLTLYNSRIKSTRFLLDSIIQKKVSPKLFINASAIGFYGDRPNETLTELSGKGSGFLSDLCNDWEQEASLLNSYGIHLAVLRIGLVLSDSGGIFTLLLKLQKFRLNILFNGGNHFLSWIHIDDLASIVESLIKGGLKAGIYNCVTPNPITQKELNHEIETFLRYKAYKFTISNRLLTFVLRDMISLLTDDNYVLSDTLQKQNYKFGYPTIRSALKVLLNKNL